MSKRQKELLERLPGDWSEFKLADYVKLGNIELEVDDEIGGTLAGLDNAIKIVAVIAGATIEELESMTMPEVNQLLSKVRFMTEHPKPLRSGKIKWKKASDTTYDDFITFVTLQRDTYNNMPLIIKAISADEMTDEEILNLPMDEVHTGFTALQSNTKRLLNRMRISSGLTLLKLIVKETLNRWLRRLRMTRKSKGKR